MHRVQLRVGAMLVMRRVYEGPDGSEIFALDESRSAATTLFGLAFIEEWTTSPSGDKICELGSRRIRGHGGRAA